MKHEMFIQAMLRKLSVVQFARVVNDLAEAEDAVQAAAVLEHYFGRSNFFWTHRQESAQELVAKQAREALGESGHLDAHILERYELVYGAVVVYLKMKGDEWLAEWPLQLVMKGNTLVGTISPMVEAMYEDNQQWFFRLLDRIADNETFVGMSNEDFVPYRKE